LPPLFSAMPLRPCHHPHDAHGCTSHEAALIAMSLISSTQLRLSTVG
jgi:hypothetical protein